MLIRLLCLLLSVGVMWEVGGKPGAFPRFFPPSKSVRSPSLRKTVFSPPKDPPTKTTDAPADDEDDEEEKSLRKLFEPKQLPNAPFFSCSLCDSEDYCLKYCGNNKLFHHHGHHGFFNGFHHMEGKDIVSNGIQALFRRKLGDVFDGHDKIHGFFPFVNAYLGHHGGKFFDHGFLGHHGKFFGHPGFLGHHRGKFFNHGLFGHHGFKDFHGKFDLGFPFIHGTKFFDHRFNNFPFFGGKQHGIFDDFHHGFHGGFGFPFFRKNKKDDDDKDDLKDRLEDECECNTFLYGHFCWTYAFRCLSEDMKKDFVKDGIFRADCILEKCGQVYGYSIGAWRRCVVYKCKDDPEKIDFFADVLDELVDKFEDH